MSCRFFRGLLDWRRFVCGTCERSSGSSGYVLLYVRSCFGGSPTPVQLRLGFFVPDFDSLRPGGAARSGGRRHQPNLASALWRSRLDPDADSDGDGLSNSAGGDRRNGSFQRQLRAAHVDVRRDEQKRSTSRMMGALGKRYELQGSEIICGNGSNKLVYGSQPHRPNESDGHAHGAGKSADEIFPRAGCPTSIPTATG